MTGIALTGRRGTGKDTLADALAKWGYFRFAWSTPIRRFLAGIYDPRFDGTPAEYAAAKIATFRVRVNGEEEDVTGTWLLQRTGTDAMRDWVDEDIWVRAGLAYLDRMAAWAGHVCPPEGCLHHGGEPIRPRRWVNTDTRFPNEVEALRDRGFLIVSLSCREDVRRDRLHARDGSYDEEADAHVSERDLSGLADVVLDVSFATPDDLAARLDARLRSM